MRATLHTHARAARQALVASCWFGVRVCVVIASGLFATPPSTSMLVPRLTFIAAAAPHLNRPGLATTR